MLTGVRPSMWNTAVPTWSRLVTAAAAASMTVGSLLLASPPQTPSNPLSSAAAASSGTACMGSWAPELNSMSSFMPMVSPAAYRRRSPMEKIPPQAADPSRSGLESAGEIQ